ncbi:ketosteroid isomerase [Macrococcoides goetzii]|nr:nuclear transport factor 2 family protein [Macrococcus goetzii]TDM45381.1 ketosteroid isomerase [Macrococcus goetzii]
MRSEQYQSIIETTYRLVEEGKLDEFFTYLADDVSWTECAGFPYGGTYVGKEEILKNVHMRLGTEWDQYTAKDIDYTFNGEKVMVFGKYSGTYKKTNKYFEADFVHYYIFNDEGKIKSFRQVTDSVQVVEAMKK